MNLTLLNSGLPETERRVYVALLELGPSSVSQITKKAGINRTLGYHVLEKLAVDGLVDRSSAAGSRIKYAATHPRSLLQYVQNHETMWQRRTKEVIHILPELVSMYKIAEKPTVRFQDGINGVKAIFNETLEAKGEILSLLDIEGWDSPDFRSWGKTYNAERSRRHIRERVLMMDTPAGRDWMRYYRGSYKYTEYRWIKPNQVPGLRSFGGEMNVFDNTVVLALLQKPNVMGVSIKSSALANLLKALYEFAWLQGRPIKVHGKKSNNGS